MKRKLSQSALKLQNRPDIDPSLFDLLRESQELVFVPPEQCVNRYFPPHRKRGEANHVRHFLTQENTCLFFCNCGARLDLDLLAVTTDQTFDSLGELNGYAIYTGLFCSSCGFTDAVEIKCS